MASPDLQRDPNRFAQRLFAPLPQHYNRLAEVLSMGQNGRWRRAMIDHIAPDRPGLVLDVACGPGGVSLQLAERTDARVVGIDLTPAMLREGQRAVAERQLGERVQLVNGRGSSCPSPMPPSTPSPSRTSSATWTTRRPPWRSWPGW